MQNSHIDLDLDLFGRVVFQNVQVRLSVTVGRNYKQVRIVEQVYPISMKNYRLDPGSVNARGHRSQGGFSQR